MLVDVSNRLMGLILLVIPGIEVLLGDSLDLLEGCQVGLVSNVSGVDRNLVGCDLIPIRHGTS